MSSAVTERHALLRKPSSTSGPALDPKRFAIQVTRSSKKLKDADEPSCKSTKERVDAAYTIATLRASVNGMLSIAMDAVQRMREHTELTVLCAICLVILGGMAVCSLNWFEDRRAVASRWAKLMESSGFVDWPQLEDPSYVSYVLAICVASPIVASICSLVVVPWSLLTRRASGIKLFKYTLVVVTLAWIVPMSSKLYPTSIDEHTAESLAWQTDGVANFNRGFCQAWCQKSEAGLAALVRGDCGSNEHTEFDEILAMFEAKEWCLQAIAHQKYELAAEYSGVSPFAGLKGDGGRTLTNMRPEMRLTSGLLWYLLPIPTMLLALFSSDLDQKWMRMWWEQ